MDGFIEIFPFEQVVTAKLLARLDDAGDLILLEAQDRTLWNRLQIAEAIPLDDEARRGTPGPFSLQAAIAALHCLAEEPEAASA